MNDVLDQAKPILGLIRDQGLRRTIEEHLAWYISNPDEWGTPLDHLLNNFHFAVPTARHWFEMTENPDKRCRYRVNGNEITNATHMRTILAILEEHRMDPKWFEYNRYRARHWDEVRWHDFKIFCILLDQGYDWSQLKG